MTALDAAVLRRPPRWVPLIEATVRGALRVGVVALVVLALACLLPSGRAALELSAPGPVGTLLAAAAVYLLGHLVRGLRLAVLLHDPVVGARKILAAHLLTAGTGLLLPFKAGDLVRMVVVGRLVGSITRGVVAVWLERSLDVAVVLALGLAAATASKADLVTPLLAASAAFVLLTAMAVTVLPDYLRALSLYLLRRPTSPGGAGLVAGLERALVVLDEAPQLLRRRTPTLVVLTLLVWAAELGALRLSAPVLAHGLLGVSRTLGGLLSSLSSGSVALLPGTLRDAVTRGAPALGGDALQRYRAVLLVPLIFCAAACGIVLSRRSWRRPERRPGPW